jgi:hypothetical protein
MSNSAQHRLAMVLNALGDNAEDVARMLQFGGWRGHPSDHHSCPVALYLRTVVTDVADAAVDSSKAVVHTVDGTAVRVDLPPAVAGFVVGFDVGAFPRLIVTATDDNGDVIDDLER